MTSGRYSPLPHTRSAPSISCTSSNRNQKPRPPLKKSLPPAVAGGGLFMSGRARRNRFRGRHCRPTGRWADHQRQVGHQLRVDAELRHARPPDEERRALGGAARLDGRDTVAVQSSSAASMLRQVVRIEAPDLGRLRFSWMVPALIPSANLRDRDLDDAPVRVVLAFEGDRSKFSARDAMLSELAHALTGEPMPYATLMYVWGNQSAPGTVLHNTRTSRIRKLVMESGPDKLGQWLEYERDVRADFEKAFGEPPGALVSIGIMTDTDNTRSTATAWYWPIRHVPVKGAP